MTRSVKESAKNKMQQLLFVGKNDEVFFFFDRCYAIKKEDDDSNYQDMCLGIIDCELSYDKLIARCTSSAEKKDVEFNAKVHHIRDDKLKEYIYNMSQESFEEQEQMPNPTIMRYGDHDEEICVVFTSNIKFEQQAVNLDTLAESKYLLFLNIFAVFNLDYHFD